MNDLLFNSIMTEILSYRTSLLICKVNQWTGFFMIGISVLKELSSMVVGKKKLQKTIANIFSEVQTNSSMSN